MNLRSWSALLGDSNFMIDGNGLLCCLWTGGHGQRAVHSRRVARLARPGADGERGEVFERTLGEQAQGQRQAQRQPQAQAQRQQQRQGQGLGRGQAQERGQAQGQALGLEQALGRVRAQADRQGGVVTLAQCQAAGVGRAAVQRLCRRGEWSRLYRGVYLVDADLLGAPGWKTRTRAALWTAGPSAVAVGHTAAAVHGIAGVPRRVGTEVEVSLPGAEARPARVVDRGLRLRQLSLSERDVTVVDGIRVTTPVRTVADLILGLDRYAAVSVMDSALHNGLVTVDEFAALPRLIRGRRGAVRARQWLAEADGRAASPLETRVRLRCTDGRVPPDTLQYRIRTTGGALLAVADFAWLAAGVLGEADGQEPHTTPRALFRDRTRQNALVSAGWTVIRFTWEDTLQPETVPTVVRRALHGASSR